MAKLNSITRTSVDRKQVNFSVNYTTEENRGNNYSTSTGYSGKPKGTQWHIEKDWDISVSCSDGHNDSVGVSGGNSTKDTAGDCSYDPLNNPSGSSKFTISIIFSWTETNGTWNFYGSSEYVYGTTNDKNYKFPTSDNYVEITDTKLTVNGYEQIPVYKKVFVEKDMNDDGVISREDLNGDNEYSYEIEYDSDNDGYYETVSEVEGEWQDSNEIDYYESGAPNSWKYEYYRRRVQAGSGTSATKSQTLSFDFYPSPEQFEFNNCEKGKQWRVDWGINSLIDNFKDFQNYATQYVHYKYGNNANTNSLTAQGACPAWSSPLSAQNLNSIYTYVKSTGGYSSGDPVKAEMFNNLAGIINE